MGKTLYLECESGISGDMVVGALLDLGASEKRLRAALTSLPVDGYSVAVTRRKVNTIDCCDFDVVLDAAHQNHDHDMAYLFGDLDAAGAEHGDHEGHGIHEGHAHHHHHEHRNLADIERIIDGGSLTPRARALAKRIFSIVAEAESKAHGVPIDQVHFHEVGAVDSIVDVVAAAVCLDDLDVTNVVVSPLAEGHGRVRTQHGVLSIPVPAVLNIVMDHGLALARRDAEGEFVTPTGAAIAAAIRTADELPDSYVVSAVGVGSGKRAYEPVSTVRAMIIEPCGGGRHGAGANGPSSDGARPLPKSVPFRGDETSDQGFSGDRVPADGLPLAGPSTSDASAADPSTHDACGHGPLWKLETEIDDCTGEALGYALDRLFEVGVREAHYVPVYMKKNRPAYQIEVLVTEDLVAAAERVLFEDTTTIGIRRYRVERTALERREQTVRTPFGEAQVKLVTLPDGHERAYPEHDSVAALAQAAHVSYQEAYRAVLRSSVGEK